LSILKHLVAAPRVPTYRPHTAWTRRRSRFSVTDGRRWRCVLSARLAGEPADRRLGRVFSARYGYAENKVTDALLIHLGHRPVVGEVGRGNYCFNFIKIYIYIHPILLRARCLDADPKTGDV